MTYNKYEHMTNWLETATNSIYGINTGYGSTATIKVNPRPTPTPTITKVIFNNPATIVIWSDGIKTVVKCGEDDIFDREKGLALAISKRYFNNKSNYYNIFKKWVPEQDVKILTPEDVDVRSIYTSQSVIKSIQKDIKAIQKDIKALQNDEDEDEGDDDDRW